MEFVKVLNTNSIDIVSYRQAAFGFQPVHEQVLRRKIICLVKLSKLKDKRRPKWPKSQK